MLTGLSFVDDLVTATRLLRAGIPPLDVVKITGTSRHFCRHAYRHLHGAPYDGKPGPSVKRIFEERNSAAGRFLVAYAERFDVLHRVDREMSFAGSALADLVEASASMHHAMFNAQEMASLVMRFIERDIDILRCRDCSSPLIAFATQAPLRCPKCHSQRADYELIAPPEAIARGIIIVQERRSIRRGLPKASGQ